MGSRNNCEGGGGVGCCVSSSLEESFRQFRFGGQSSETMSGSVGVGGGGVAVVFWVWMCDCVRCGWGVGDDERLSGSFGGHVLVPRDGQGVFQELLAFMRHILMKLQ